MFSFKFYRPKENTSMMCNYCKHYHPYNSICIVIYLKPYKSKLLCDKCSSELIGLDMFDNTNKLIYTKWCYICQEPPKKNISADDLDSYLEIKYIHHSSHVRSSESLLFHLKCLSPKFLQMAKDL